MSGGTAQPPGGRPAARALVEFGVLGDLEIRASGRRVAAGHARQRSVLAVLLLDLGRAVPVDQLIDRVWGEEPPASVRNVLYGYVARLRAVLATAGDPEVTLGRGPGGYLLDAEPERVDLYRFRRLTAEAAAAGDDRQAGELLRGALGLWRGPALAGLTGPWLSGMRESLDVQRMAAVLDLGDIALRQGQHGALAGELASETVAYPADERLIGQLMLALYRSGRQAEALEWFEQTRRRLAEEFGADPGEELRALHQRILRADPALTGSGAVSHHDGNANGTGCPRELPVDVVAFTGRGGELAELDRLVAAAGGTGVGGGAGAAAVISAVSGTAGVGKTALAVHWAHRAAESFPDGQLYVNLRGYDPGRPVSAADALAGFLRALGVAGQDIPPGQDERAARYRSLLAGRRVLVLADNAGEVAQVRPLLPATGGCVMVVTSRDSLAGLVARDGARRLDLDLLPHRDAAGLLRALIGERADADPDAVAALAGRCARLPLALRVAAELAVARPDVPLADLAGELADRQSRLDVLDAGGDPGTAVRAVFSWSYQHLDDGTAGAFRLLGLHPGPGFDAYAAAALTAATLAQARRLLGLLARAHLIQPAGPGRYTMHDLLRAYAAELAAARDSDGERRAALTRLFDHYLHTAATAMDTLFPAERHQRPRLAAPITPVPPLPDPAAARNWLDSQRPSLVAVAVHAADHGWPGHATRLASILFRYLEAGGHYSEAIIIHGHARRAAHHTRDRNAEMSALNALGLADLHQGRCARATGHFQQVLNLSRQAGDRIREARALGNLGTASLHQGSYAQAVDYYQQALARHRENGEQVEEANVLVNLSIVDHRQGRSQSATRRCQRAIALAKQTGDKDIEAYGLLNLGIVGLRLGRYQQAADQLRHARRVFCEIGNRSGEASVLARLGYVALEQGHHPQATDHLQRALAIFRDMGERDSEAEACNGLGEVLLATGRPRDAAIQYTTALGLAADKYEQARAYHGLGHTCQASGDPVQARQHWQQALALYSELGAPEAEHIRAQLAAAGDRQEHAQA
jgi:DNA-binding SARP family transcriptional activator/tetratricopeptide (TPR) repeat protein